MRRKLVRSGGRWWGKYEVTMLGANKSRRLKQVVRCLEVNLHLAWNHPRQQLLLQIFLVRQYVHGIQSITGRPRRGHLYEKNVHQVHGPLWIPSSKGHLRGNSIRVNKTHMPLGNWEAVYSWNRMMNRWLRHESLVQGWCPPGTRHTMESIK